MGTRDHIEVDSSLLMTFRWFEITTGRQLQLHHFLYKIYKQKTLLGRHLNTHIRLLQHFTFPWTIFYPCTPVPLLPLPPIQCTPPTRVRWFSKNVFSFFLASPLYCASDQYRKVYMIFLALSRCLDPPPTMSKCDTFIKGNWPKFYQNHILALILDKLVKTLCRLH